MVNLRISLLAKLLRAGVLVLSCGDALVGVDSSMHSKEQPCRSRVAWVPLAGFEVTFYMSGLEVTIFGGAFFRLKMAEKIRK